jgi:hypothetical protein
MKLSSIKNLLLSGVIAAGAAVMPMTSASAQTSTAPQTGTAPETTVPGTTAPDATTTAPDTTAVDNNDDGFGWGWLGLLGLIGLAGLAGRKSDDQTAYRSDSTTDPTTVSGRSDYRR